MWPNLQIPADLVTFAEEILNGKFHFLCSDTPTSLNEKLGIIPFYSYVNLLGYVAFS